MAANPRNNASRRIRRLLPALAVPAVALAAYFLSLAAHYNFHIVSSGLVYRSAQMNGEALAETISHYGIKSILNLRGPGPDKDWYVAEVDTARRLGVQHFDYALSASHELKDAEMDEILATIRDAPKPVLIHCKSGSDRTGLVGALYLYGLEGRSASAAGRQLTVRYGHVPHLLWSGTEAMDNSFWRYVKNHKQPAADAPRGPAGRTDASTLTGPWVSHNPAAN
jgi:protein tyrosine/serine phosphatase